MMNVYKQQQPSGIASINRRIKCCFKQCPLPLQIVTCTTLVLLILHITIFNNLTQHEQIRQQELQLRTERVNKLDRPPSIIATTDESIWKGRAEIIQTYQDKLVKDRKIKEASQQCPYKSLSDLTDDQKQPTAGIRHMVAPPSGGKIHLVCCQTTKGTLSIVAHDKWAPIGTARFLEMVTSGYFNHGVPMMRCVENFLCQFGLSSSKEHRKDFDDSIKDDPNWLPEGPTHRENALGVKRFAEGYLAYAGAGVNSRSKQLIVALKANGPLAGGSPWEVPWGELVGEASFETLSKIYTGYGEDGPKQGMLHNNGMTDDMKLVFPKLDYIEGCEVLDEHDYG